MLAKVRYSRHHDLSTSTGLLSTFQAIRRVITGGFLWLGIPCSSFIWLSRGSTFRSSLRPRGKKRLRKVRETNRMVRRLLYVFLGEITLDGVQSSQAPMMFVWVLFQSRAYCRALLRWAKDGICLYEGDWMVHWATFEFTPSLVSAIGGRWFPFCSFSELLLNLYLAPLCFSLPAHAGDDSPAQSQILFPSSWNAWTQLRESWFLFFNRGVEVHNFNPIARHAWSHGFTITHSLVEF